MTDVARFGHGSRVPGWDDAVDLDRDPAEIPDPATTPVPEDLRAAIERHMAAYPDRRSAAIPALRAAQRVHGWCSPEAIAQVACVMRLTPGNLAAIATFYDMLETDLQPPAREPRLATGPQPHPQREPRHDIYVCTNISCSLRGADALYAAVRAAAAGDPDVNVRAFECLGACDIAPMASADGVYVGPLEPADAARLLDDVRAGRPVLPDKQLLRRPVADPHANTREFPRPQPAPPPDGDPVMDPRRAVRPAPPTDGEPATHPRRTTP
jgi:NADH:ubiquinone oxidoreductase subunit E